MPFLTHMSSSRRTRRSSSCWITYLTWYPHTNPTIFVSAPPRLGPPGFNTPGEFSGSRSVVYTPFTVEPHQGCSPPLHKAIFSSAILFQAKMPGTSAKGTPRRKKSFSWTTQHPILSSHQLLREGNPPRPPFIFNLPKASSGLVRWFKSRTQSCLQVLVYAPIEYRAGKWSFSWERTQKWNGYSREQSNALRVSPRHPHAAPIRGHTL